MRTIRHFPTDGHRDGPASPTTPPARAPHGHPTGSSDNRKPGSARPHAGSGGTRNMAQVTNVPASVPMRGGGLQPRAGHTGTPGKGLA